MLHALKLISAFVQVAISELRQAGQFRTVPTVTRTCALRSKVEGLLACICMLPLHPSNFCAALHGHASITTISNCFLIEDTVTAPRRPIAFPQSVLDQDLKQSKTFHCADRRNWYTRVCMLYVVKQLAVRTDVPALARILRTSAAGCFSVQRGRVVPTVTRKCLSSGQSAKLRIRTAATAAGPITVSTMPESAVQGLQPQALWDYFHDLTQIPRPSKFEDK